jgi:putative transposase
LSSEEKVSFVESVRDEYPLTVALSVAELPKSTWYYHQRYKVSVDEKYAHLRPILEKIAREHPEYGYRRTQKELAEAYGYVHSKELVRQLHKRWHLRLFHNKRRSEPSQVRQAIQEAGQQANMVAQMADIGLFEVLYTDFTELRFANGTRKAYLMPIIGHTSRLAFGWAIGPSANTEVALAAWQRARHTMRDLSIDWSGMVMHHDQDPVYTGYAWTQQLLLEDGLYISYALNGARDNPQMESFIGHFKDEGCSLFLEAETVSDLHQVVDQRMVYYNSERRHSSIGYQSPLAYIQQVRGEDDW